MALADFVDQMDAASFSALTSFRLGALSQKFEESFDSDTDVRAFLTFGWERENNYEKEYPLWILGCVFDCYLTAKVFGDKTRYFLYRK